MAVSKIGKRIKDLREERGFSQSDLGKLAKINPLVISRYENAVIEPTINNLRKLAKSLQVTIDYLVFDGEKKEEVEFSNPILKEKLLTLSKVSKKDQEAIIRLLDAVIVKNQVKGVAQNIEE